MSINVSSMTRKVEVDSRIPLRYYYRIADNLLNQASIYRDEKNIVDLYIILLRFSSLVSETIPFHQEYLVSLSKEKAIYKKKLLAVLNELESLKPEFQHRMDERNKAITGALMFQLDGLERTSYGSVERPSVSKQSNSSMDIKQPGSMTAGSSWKYNNYPSHTSSPNPLQVDKQLHKLRLNVPLPKEETLSRHSFLGPNGLQGQWLGPSTHMKAKVQYPSYTDFTPKEDPGLNQAAQNGLAEIKDGNLEAIRTPMESVLSLDNGRWTLSTEESCPPLISESWEDPFPVIRQPSPPPVLAQVQQGYAPISPSKVADPRPGPAIFSQDEVSGSNAYQHLHVPVKLMEDFLRLARSNTENNLETCAILAGSLKNRVFQISTLIVPKQVSTSDSCSTLDEEEIFEVQDKFSLFPLGWIHTHPSQTCFMSSVDLHTHYSYQIMLPEAIAIVMAPTDSSSPHGIFHLSDPSGESVIRNCQQRGFHPHEEPSDGSPIYEHCSHVFMNPKLRFEVIDLR